MLVKLKEYNTAIKNSKLALATDLSRPIFTNFHVFTEDTKMIIESLDGFRLHRSTIELKERAEDEKAMNILVKNLQPVKSKATYIDVTLTDNILKVDTNLYQIEKEYSVDNYVDTNKVIPSYNTEDKDIASICFNPKYMMDALKNVCNDYSNIKKGGRSQLTMIFNNKNKISPILLVSGNQLNMVLPERKQGG